MRVVDLIARSAFELKRAGVLTSHHSDNALDEARELVLHALHLPNDWPANLAVATLLPSEITDVQTLVQQRITQRVPAAYLTGTAIFADMRFHTDARALVPRSPIAELVRARYRPWLQVDPKQVLDLCAGSGCIGIATAAAFANASVCLADISLDALSLASENIALHRMQGRVQCVQSDLFAALTDRRFDLIVSNPPYITDADYAQMAAEYAHEPKLGLTSGADGLDHPLRILQSAALHLQPDGVLILEVGEAWRALDQLLPGLRKHWIDFTHGAHMGVLATTKAALQESQLHIDTLAKIRSP